MKIPFATGLAVNKIFTTCINGKPEKADEMIE